MNNYYVYLHRRATDNRVFYVGKGKGQRAYNFHNRNKYWHHVARKHGVVVDIVFDNLIEEDALRCEVDIITELHYFGCELTNMSSGGESPVYTDEYRKKLSESRKGRKPSPETVAKIVMFHKGRKRSDETRKNISNSLRGKKVDPERARRSAESRTGTKSSVADKTHYTFVYVDGTTFTGTRMELCEKFELNKKGISKLFCRKSRRNSSQGWGVVVGDEQVNDVLLRIISTNKGTK